MSISEITDQEKALVQILDSVIHEVRTLPDIHRLSNRDDAFRLIRNLQTMILARPTIRAQSNER